MDTGFDSAGTASWVDLLLNRRSRRFGLGMRMPSGPHAYTSRHSPQSLAEEEEAQLAFAAAGITGPSLADVCWGPGEGGNIMSGLVGRTTGSGDGIQSVALFVINDQSTWLMKRPRDFSPAEIPELVSLARERSFTEVYRRSRILVKAGRSAPPVDPLFNLRCNRWAAHAPGTTWFLPVNDLSFLYINGLLDVFNEETGAYVLDERASFRPAGLARFARSRGGHLEDDPRAGRVVTVELVERLVTEFVTVEQGMMIQNLALMTEALGLGGCPSFANHEFGWFEALGFRMGRMPASRYLGANLLVRLGMRLLRQDVPVPYPIGLELDGKPWLRAFCPPYFGSMAEAVRAVVDTKAQAFRLAGPTAWIDPGATEARRPPISEAAIAATTAYCDYLWERYGRFPSYLAPFRTVVGFQACHLDAEFYDRFYRPEVLTRRHRDRFARDMGATGGGGAIRQ
jgi:hypothetical protein